MSTSASGQISAPERRPAPAPDVLSIPYLLWSLQAFQSSFVRRFEYQVQIWNEQPKNSSERSNDGCVMSVTRFLAGAVICFSAGDEAVFITSCRAP